MLVSIILPVYNVEEYLAFCLNSLIAQSYRNIEIIIVDDGANDSSGTIADEYAIKDKRIRVIHKENGGVASARNAGLAAATGEFIIFVDPDDWITSDHVEYLLHLQSIDDSDMCMSTLLFTQKGEKQAETICEKTISNKEAATMLLSPSMYVGSYGKIYRRQWLLDNNIWQNETIYSGEGLHFTITAAQAANHVTISNKKIYYYRRNVSKSATTKFNIKMFSNNEHSLNVIREEQKIDYEDFDIMWKLFRTHLFISGILAIETNATKKDYPDEYKYWMQKIKEDKGTLIKSKIVPYKSKVRIVLGSSMPRLWAKIAARKRKKIFDKSV